MNSFDKRKLLEGKLGEYISLGLKTKILDDYSADIVHPRLSEVHICENPELETTIYNIDNGIIGRIEANPERCKEYSEEYPDRVIFRCLTQHVNEVFRDIHVYSSSQIYSFGATHSNFEGKNRKYDVVEGMETINRLISQYVARTLVQEKYQRGVELPDITLEGINALEKFSKTIYPNDKASLLRLVKDALSDQFLDNMFIAYSNKKDGNTHLVEILSRLGTSILLERDTTEEKVKALVYGPVHKAIDKVLEQEK